MPATDRSLTLRAAAAALLVVFAAAAVLAVRDPGAEPASAASIASRSDGGRLQRLVLRDPGSGRRHAVLVLRPRGPDSARYPVVYLLHGVPGGADDAFSSGIASAVGAFSRARHRRVVIVAPDGNGGKDDTEWADDVAPGGDHLASFVTDVVVPAVERGHVRPRSRRTIAGFSMGGYGAANLATRDPALFGRLATFAGYFRVDDPDGVFGGNASVEAANSPDRHVAALAGTRVLLADGAQDRDPVVRGEARRFAGLLRAAGQRPALSITRGGHTWSWVATRFPQLLRFATAR